MFFIFLRQNLFRASKNFGRILQNILFFLVSYTVFFLLMQNQLNQDVTASQQFLICNIIWFSLLFSLIFANADFLAEDYRDGTVEQMIIFCPNLEVYIISKIITTWLIFCLPILAIIPLTLFALGFDANFIGHFLILIALASLVINFICAFCGSLNAAENSAPILAILALPLIIPILLIACGGFVGGASSPKVDSASFYFALKILVGLAVLVGAVLTLATAKIAKVICE